MLFPDPVNAAVPLCLHAERAWTHRRAVSDALRRGRQRCHDCGTAVPGWMEIHHLDDDHGNWAAGNLVPICQFCHLARHPAQPGLAEMDPLRVIWWPELTQRAVCSMAWASAWLLTICADASAAGVIDARTAALECLRDQIIVELNRRLQAAERVIGTASPAAMLNVAVRRAGEPESWHHLRWWPEAGSDINGDLIRWLPGTGLSAVPVSSAAACLAAAPEKDGPLEQAGRVLAAAAAGA